MTVESDTVKDVTKAYGYDSAGCMTSAMITSGGIVTVDQKSTYITFGETAKLTGSISNEICCCGSIYDETHVLIEGISEEKLRELAFSEHDDPLA